MKTTRKQFEAFKAEVLRWQKRLGLTDWRVCFDHGQAKGAYGELFANREGRISTVVFANRCDGDGLIGFDPVNTGRHEALELLLAPMKDIARSRDFRESDLDEAAHAVIRRLESLFDAMDHLPEVES